ncbi:MAG: hypothetical protein H7282_07835 [Cytophagaceae bacterium]|nr:hypothetical protein [Cytophagaceae bacterium]
MIANLQLLLRFIFGSDSSGCYGLLNNYGDFRYTFVKEKMKELAFFKIDLKGEFVFTKKIELKYKEESIRLFRAYNIGDNYFLFGSYLAKDKKTFTILAYPIDKKGNLATPIEVLTSATFDEGWYNYNLYQDDDSSAFYIWSPDKEKDNVETAFHLHGFDTSLNHLWTKEFKLPADEFYRVDKMIFKKSKLYVLGRIPRDMDVKRLEKYKLSSYDLITYQSAHETITLNTGIAARCFMNLDEQGNPILAGFYVKELRLKYDSKYLDGFFCMKYDFKSGSQLFSVQQEFPYEVLTEFVSEKKAKLGGPLLLDLDVKSISTRLDGSMYIVSEHYAHVYAGEHIYYNYQNLIVTSISKEGIIEWFKTIPKPKQSSIMIDNIKFYSYLKGSVGDNVYFMYNENYDNPNRPKTIDHAGLINCNDVITSLATLDRKGNLARQTIFKEDNPKNKTCIEPVNSLKLSENTFILYRTSGQDAKLGLLKFEK